MNSGFWMTPSVAVTGLDANETKIFTHFYADWGILEMNIHLDS